MKTTFKYAIICCMALTMAGCAITGGIKRRKLNAGLDYTPKPPIEADSSAKTAPDSLPKSRMIEYTTVSGEKRTLFIDPTSTTYKGEKIGMYTFDPLTVRAKRSHTLPERNGKVLIDFVITLPKQLQGDCQSIAVTPMLHNRGETTPLEGLTIRGELFSRVQDRNYWQYEQYCNLFKPDMLGKERAFQRFVKNPYPQGARLDSIIVGRETISYFYTQEIETHEVGKQVKVTLQGNVVALDRSSYRLPISDTLVYNISSMLAFADTSKHFVTQIIEKYAVVKDRNYLNFKVNKTDIVDSLGDNRAQLGRIEGLMDQLVNQKEFYVDSIILTASASPEGSVRQNNLLAQGRAYSLRDYLAEKFKGSSVEDDGNGSVSEGGGGAESGGIGGRGVGSLISVRWIGEDWRELVRLVQQSDLPHRDQILAMMAGAGISEVEEAVPEGIAGSLKIAAGHTTDRTGNLDDLERSIRELYPVDYKVMLEVLYPRLRAVTFKYDLRRVGMVKDTIHTTVPDTLYAHGYQLLNDRRYAEALRILSSYNDRNTAICLLSLGRDSEALELLSSFPRSAITEYMQAIACARLGRREEGLEHYNEACRLNQYMKQRGTLDPEITTLIHPPKP